MKTARILLTADQQSGSQANAPWTSFGQNEYRRYDEGVARITEVMASGVTQHAITPIDFFVSIGDLGDTGTGNDETTWQAMFDAVSGSAWAGSTYYGLGNHEGSSFSTNWSVYKNMVDTVQSAYTNVYTVNEGGHDVDKAFSWDNGGVHYIMMGAMAVHSSNLLDVGENQYIWLAADLAANVLPVVVFVHLHIAEVHKTISPFDYINDIDSAVIRALLEADGNVRIVFQGHYHASYHPPVFIGDILYVGLYGAVNAPESGDNAWFIANIKMNAYRGDSDYRCNLELEGYGTKGQSVNYTQFGIV